jgi:hypothetical protein
MLRLVDADEVGLPMGIRMGGRLLVYMGADINQCHVSGQATFSGMPECYCYCTVCPSLSRALPC